MYLKTYNLPIMYPLIQIAFQYSLEGKYLVISSDDHATIPPKHDVLICVPTKGHMCQLDTSPYPTKKL